MGNKQKKSKIKKLLIFPSLNDTTNQTLPGGVPTTIISTWVLGGEPVAHSEVPIKNLSFFSLLLRCRNYCSDLFEEKFILKNYKIIIKSRIFRLQITTTWKMQGKNFTPFTFMQTEMFLRFFAKVIIVEVRERCWILSTE